MRFCLYICLAINAIVVSGCKPENGMHELVHFDEVSIASDEVYVRFLSEEIDRYPKATDNYIKLAGIYERHSNIAKALELLQDAEKENPEHLDILLHLSSLYLKEERVEELAKTLKTIRKLDPDNMDFLKLSARFSLLHKDYTNAVFFANRAMLANPYDDENYYLRGRAQLINKDSISALNSFEEAYKLKNSYKNFSAVFDVSLASGDHIKAREYLEVFSAKNSSKSLCYEWGAYYNEIGERKTAKDILVSCLKKSPEEIRVNFELGKIYFIENNMDSTHFYLDQFLNTNPKGTEAYVLKARTLEKVSYYSDARNLYKTALEIDSTSTLAIQGLESLERKVAYLRLVNRKEDIQREIESLKPLKSKVIN